MGDAAVIQIHHVRQAAPVLRVVNRIVAGVHDPPSAGSLLGVNADGDSCDAQYKSDSCTDHAEGDTADDRDDQAENT